MKILHFLGLSKKSAATAKERLQIVVSHQRTEGGDVDFLPKMRHELLTVISKYVKINPEQINVQLQRNGNCSILELNIMLPTATAVESAAESG